jgi:hypothetical protein
MSDKAFRDFMGRMNQIGQVLHFYNPLEEDMKNRITFGAGGEAIITLPPGGEFCFVVTAYDTQCHLEEPKPAQTLNEGGRLNR